MQYDLTDIVLFLGIAQGFFLAFALNKISNKNEYANRTLSQILIMAALMLLGKLMFDPEFVIRMFRWIALTDSIIFLIGPLCYTYIRRLIFQSEKPFKLRFLHYIPAILHFSMSLYFTTIDRNAYIALYHNGTLTTIFNIVELSGIILNSFYLAKNYFLLNNYRNQEKLRLSYTNSFHKFLLYFLAGIGITLLAWLISYLNSYYFHTTIAFLNYKMVWITIPAFIYVVGYFSLNQPELFRIPPTAIDKSFAKRLSDLDATTLRQNLEQLLVRDRIYLKNNLTLSELSKKLEASSNDISWLLNNEYKSNFYDFINQYRIKEFMQRIDDNVHAKQTILSIALDVGFNSKSTFNKAFKTQMNSTPSDYIKNLKNLSHAV